MEVPRSKVWAQSRSQIVPWVQDWLTPHRAALLDACAASKLDFNTADTLSLLYPDATVADIMGSLHSAGGNLERVRYVTIHR